VTVLIRDNESWSEHAFINDQTAQGVVLPGFAVPLTDLWAVIEGVEDGEIPS
jgi:hypothetical protein